MQIPCVYLPGPVPAVSVANSYNAFGADLWVRRLAEVILYPDPKHC